VPGEIENTRHLEDIEGRPRFNIVKFDIVEHVAGKEMACDLCEAKNNKYLKLYVGNGGCIIMSGTALLCEKCVGNITQLFNGVTK